MGFVKNDQIVGNDGSALQAGKNLGAGQGVHADDETVARLSQKRIVVAGIRSRHDAERQVEQGQELASPVAHQTGGRNN